MSKNHWSLFVSLGLSMGLLVLGGFGLNQFELSGNDRRDAFVFMGHLLAIIIGTFVTIFNIRQFFKTDDEIVEEVVIQLNKGEAKNDNTKSREDNNGRSING